MKSYKKHIKRLRRRAHQMEAVGKAREAVAMLVRELDATMTVHGGGQILVVPHHLRRLAACAVLFENLPAESVALNMETGG